eukprot:Nk52_evm92s2367 gene=Nk52_evmTU92s2367
MPIKKRRSNDLNLNPNISSAKRYNYSLESKYVFLEVIRRCRQENVIYETVSAAHPMTRAADYCNVPLRTIERVWKEFEDKGELVESKQGIQLCIRLKMRKS